MLRNLLKNTDYIILICVLLLMIIGVIGIYTAGYSTQLNKTEYIKQIVWIGIVSVIMVVIWMVDYNIFDIFGYLIYLVHLVLLVAVLFTPKLMGASSWFNLGSFLYQPSELMKIGYILCMAKFMTIYKTKSGISEKGSRIFLSIIMMILFLLPFVLILLQPDFGTAVVFVVITAFMIFKMGIKYRYVVALILLILVLIPLLYFFVLNPTQQQRIKVFLDPTLDPLGSGYNAIQSQIAIGSGMIFGTGLLKGAQTQFGYLPIKSTDFIFSVISEELGFVFSILIVILFVVLIIRIVLVANLAKDEFASLVAIGIAGIFFFHFVENIGMAIGLLPITGVPLPFVSYGGSSLITNSIGIAIVLNISARKSKNVFLE